jgi:hypothetical protein
MSKRNSFLLILLFVLIYVPFLLNHGYGYISIDMIDFPSYYSAAKITFKDHRSPYEYQDLHQTGTFIGPPFLYPPPSLLVFYPFSLLSLQGAQTLLLFISHISILLFFFLFFFKILKMKFEGLFIGLALIYVFSYHPTVHSLWLGQVNLLILLMLILSWYTLQKDGHPGLVALPFSLAIIIKTYPALLLVYLLVKRKFAVVFWILGLLSGYFIIALIFLPREVWIDWLTVVVPSGGYGNAALGVLEPTSPWNQSLNGFFSRIFIPTEYSHTLINSPAAARVLTYVFSLVIIIVATRLCYLASKKYKSDKIMNIEFSVFLLTVYLIAPFSWEHHLVFVLPAIMVVIYLLFHSKDNVVICIIVGAAVLMIAWYVPIIEFPALRRGLLVLGISLKLYAVIVLWIYLIAKLRLSLSGRSDLEFLSSD